MNIVYSSSEYYFKPTIVSVYSMLKNSLHKHTVYLLSSGISDASKVAFTELVTSMGSIPEILEIDALLESKAIEFKLPKMRNNYSTYARLFLSEILDVESVLLIDSDTLVVGEIEDVLDEVTDDGVMFAARDFVISNKYSRHEDTELSNSNYFNMGVLYVNLKNWREQNLTSIIKNSYDHTHTLKIADQTIVNKYLSQFITEIGLRFNWYTYFRYDFSYEFYCRQNNKTVFVSNDKYEFSRANPVIIHFIGTWFERPWFKSNICDGRDLYLTYWNELFSEADLFNSPKIAKDTLYGYISVLFYKLCGIKAYFKFRYIFVQKLKR